MANNCYYDMRVKGKLDDIKEFSKVMNSYDEPRHFWRVFSCYEDYGQPDENGDVVASFSGDCAWSVRSCMMDGSGTYAHDVEEDMRTSIPDESKRLNLEIEVYSEEEGMCFQEHYHYKNGIELANECVDFYCYYFDYIRNEAEEDTAKRFEEFKKENDLPDNISMDDLDDNDDIRIGGFGEWDFSI